MCVITPPCPPSSHTHSYNMTHRHSTQGIPGTGETCTRSLLKSATTISPRPVRATPRGHHSSPGPLTDDRTLLPETKNYFCVIFLCNTIHRETKTEERRVSEEIAMLLDIESSRLYTQKCRCVS